MNLRLSGFQKLALASVIATWIMVVIGVIVRSTGSGMGCPDWPLCYGQVIPRIGDTAAWLDRLLLAQPWVAGDRFTVADITAFCTLEFARLLKLRPADAGLHALQAWRDRVAQRPSAAA